MNGFDRADEHRMVTDASGNEKCGRCYSAWPCTDASTERPYKLEPYRVPVQSPAGAFFIDVAHGGEVIRVNDGAGHSFTTLRCEGREWRVKAVLDRKGDGAYETARTPKGNEAGHGLEIVEPSPQHEHRPAPKRVRDKLRAVVLEAVAAHLRANLQLLREARQAHLNNEIRYSDGAIAKAELALAKLREKKAALEADERAALEVK